MKRIILTLVATAGVLSVVNAQNPTGNGGFENWTNAGTYEEPDGWGTLNVISAFVTGAPVTVEKSTDHNAGQYSAKLTTAASPVDLAPVLGAQYEYDTLPGVLLSNSVLGGFIGVPYTQRPIGASFYLKYNPVNGDSAAVLIQLTKYVGGQTTIVGQAFGIANTSMPDWEYVGMPIQYQNNNTPDSITVVVMSSAYGLKALSPTFASLPIIAPQPGTTLFVDDFSLLTTGLDEQDPTKLNFTVYPNPASSNLTLATTGHQFGDRALKVEMYDMTGRLVKTIDVESAIQNVNVGDMSSGMYVYTLKDGQNVLRTGKFSVTK